MHPPKCCGSELVEDPRVGLLLVDALLVVEAELRQHLGPEDGGQPLGEGDVLQLGHHHPPRLLVHHLVQPHRVRDLVLQTLVESVRDAIVLIEEEVLEGCQRGLRTQK